jgi:hypothetical protein
LDNVVFEDTLLPRLSRFPALRQSITDLRTQSMADAADDVA